MAFNAYISSCTIFLNCSYAGPILILLLRGRKTLTAERPDFPLGRVGGYVANVVAVVYVGVTSVVCFFFIFAGVFDNSFFFWIVEIGTRIVEFFYEILLTRWVCVQVLPASEY